ncbi:peroxiredoxin-6 [Eupeodes corollae]|uniref:peroxiredoxin-6 n=1 Tax=Eupeodes corollae TaxID=290404 RepID=UPI002490F72A|nr:peroxiredoxin-6 [Eupeodes corollae]XP_055903430.1 peroxiredoxin-6 [Eupeodes corollae]
MSVQGKALNLGDQFPNFQAETTIGRIDFYEWMGDSWAILFSHPSDYTPVCTTELSRVAGILPEFTKRNIKPIALSCDSVESHKGWIEDIKSFAKLSEFGYPIIADDKRELAVKLNMLDKDERDKAGIPLTCRAVFIIDASKKLRLTLLYPASTGRNFNEILRVIDSLKLTDNNKVATPADWEHGKECMVLPTVQQDDIPKLFPQGIKTVEVPSGKKYLRMTPQP